MARAHDDRAQPISVLGERPVKPNRYRVEAVDRAMLLLDALASAPGSTAAQLAQARDANRSLVFRMLSTMADRGFVTKDEHNCYRLGPRLLSLAQQAAHGDVILDASRKALDDLLEQTQESIYLVVREGMEVMCVDTRTSPQKIRLIAERGYRRIMGVGTTAMVQLPYLPKELYDAVMAYNYGPDAPRPMRSREEVEALLPRVRDAGFHESVTDEPDVYTISAPVWNWRGEVAAVICIDAPLSRVPPERAAEIRGHVLAASDAISVLLGGRPRFGRSAQTGSIF